MFRIKIKEFEIVEIRIEEGVDIGYEIKYSLFPNMLPKGGDSLIVQCCVSGRHH